MSISDLHNCKSHHECQKQVEKKQDKYRKAKGCTPVWAAVPKCVLCSVSSSYFLYTILKNERNESAKPYEIYANYNVSISFIMSHVMTLFSPKPGINGTTQHKSKSPTNL
jgi:hypothetical protein